MIENKEDLTIEQRKYILEKLKEKNINDETIESVLEFCYVQKVAFSNMLNVDELIEDVVDKLNYNIEYKKIVDTEEGKKIKIEHAVCFGNGRIVLNPKYKGKEKGRIIKLHELTHLKDTEVVEMSQEEIETKKKQALDKEKNKKKRKKLEENIKSYLNQEDKIYISGVSEGLSDYAEWGTDLGYFVEGVTQYKQGKYEDILGIKRGREYFDELPLIESCIELIGEEKFLKYYNNHDFGKIRNEVFENTQGTIKLEETIDLLNRSTNQEMKNYYHYITRTSYKKQIKMMSLIAKCRNKGIYIPQDKMNLKSLKKLAKQNEVKLLEKSSQKDTFFGEIKVNNEDNHIEDYAIKSMEDTQNNREDYYIDNKI